MLHAPIKLLMVNSLLAQQGVFYSIPPLCGYSIDLLALAWDLVTIVGTPEPNIWWHTRIWAFIVFL